MTKQMEFGMMQRAKFMITGFKGRKKGELTSSKIYKVRIE